MAKRNSKRLHMPTGHKPLTPDPTLEEIWGPGGLAEQERMKRPANERYERDLAEQVRRKKDSR